MGSLSTDYRQSCRQLERRKQLEKAQGEDVTPLLFLTELNKRKLNPSLVSEGTNGSMVGGGTISLRRLLRPELKELARDDQRVVGLYEESWQKFETPKPGAHGLHTSDVTLFADAAV